MNRLEFTSENLVGECVDKFCMPDFIEVLTARHCEIGLEYDSMTNTYRVFAKGDLPDYMKPAEVSTDKAEENERENKLNGYAETFNQYMKKGNNGSIIDATPQKILSLIHDEFDDEREEAEWHNDNLFLQATDFELALVYVKKRINMHDVQCAKLSLGAHNMELVDVDEELSDKIADLMEEYGSKYGLAEGWWFDEGTTEDILWKL